MVWNLVDSYLDAQVLKIIVNVYTDKRCKRIEHNTLYSKLGSFLALKFSLEHQQ
jgi:hypothetical protein